MLLSFCGNGAERVSADRNERNASASAFFLCSSLPFESKLYLTPPKLSAPKGMPLIPTFRKQTISHAAKTKHPKSYAPHPYLAKILTANASKIKNAKF